MKYVFVFALLFAASCTNNPSPNAGQQTEEGNRPDSPKRDNTKKKIILTFDDGPTTGSKRLYELLLQEKIPVALYLVGEHYTKMPAMHYLLDSLRKQPYITFCNHSFSHAFHDKYVKYYSTPGSVVDEYLKVDTLIGINSHIARCAGRNLWRTQNVIFTDTVAKGKKQAGLYPAGPDSLYKLGMQFTGWDFTWPYDYKTFKNTRDVAGMMNRIRIYFDSALTKQPNYAVVLGHDQQFADDEDFNQLKVFIDSIKNSKLYEFVSIKEYPGVK